MSYYDQDILRQAERDGIRTMSGHHIRTPEPEDDEPTPDDELFATRTEWREHPDG